MLGSHAGVRGMTQARPRPAGCGERANLFATLATLVLNVQSESLMAHLFELLRGCLSVVGVLVRVPASRKRECVCPGVSAQTSNDPQTQEEPFFNHWCWGILPKAAYVSIFGFNVAGGVLQLHSGRLQQPDDQTEGDACSAELTTSALTCSMLS